MVWQWLSCRGITIMRGCNGCYGYLLAALDINDRSKPAWLENPHVGFGSLIRAGGLIKKSLGTTKTKTGTLLRLEFCYLDIAHYFFDFERIGFSAIHQCYGSMEVELLIPSTALTAMDILLTKNSRTDRMIRGHKPLNFPHLSQHVITPHAIRRRSTR
jgi:hypothetical protein